jgi:hypothetical protein
MQPLPNPPHVLAGIRQVMDEFARHGIAKEGENQQQGFRFRGIDQVLDRMGRHLVDANLVIIPALQTRDVVERVNSRGNPLLYVTVTVEYTILSAVDGSQVKAVFPGEAMDSGDKATNKALSAAYKYMAFQLFSIPVAGEDADSQSPTLGRASHNSGSVPTAGTNVPTLGTSDIAAIRALCAEAKFDEAKLLEIYAVPAIEAVPLSAVAEITSNLQKKIKSKKEKA